MVRAIGGNWILTNSKIMKKFNHSAIEGLRVAGQLQHAKLSFCNHNNCEIIEYYGICMHNEDDEKDKQDAKLFKQLRKLGRSQSNKRTDVDFYQ